MLVNRKFLFYLSFIHSRRLYQYSANTKSYADEKSVLQKITWVYHTLYTCRGISSCSRKQFFHIVNLDGHFQKPMLLAGLGDAQLNLNLSKQHIFIQTQTSQ